MNHHLHCLRTRGIELNSAASAAEGCMANPTMAVEQGPGASMHQGASPAVPVDPSRLAVLMPPHLPCPQPPPQPPPGRGQQYICRPVYRWVDLTTAPAQDGPPADIYTFL